jgi:transposase
MMGERRVMQEALFYGFSLERHVPSHHLLRKIDRFVDLSGLRTHLGPYCSDVGRPAIDPELMMRMLIVGYCFGIRSERRLCEEVHLNLAYRWFCRLGLDADVPAEGEVLDVLVQSKRNKHAALKLMRKLLKKYAFVPERLVTDDLRSYSAAVRELGIECRHERGRWKNNRAENLHQPTRRRGDVKPHEAHDEGLCGLPSADDHPRRRSVDRAGLCSRNRRSIAHPPIS